ncbi:hypothetical protein SERLA73DRAFT_169051 [Serpula lacrymans var. lacrymans S7.3]|uniref:Uncharacterized protein n=2 Tax=Serpula lacrymans var. lacrymans TaxID=341189 RepID=F8Q0X1_SERL3|nr:uncharacterized protein SERLADRAFT_449904 [Serpula lacrymans var. lacrymans S7.9]EGN97949.1 hypothetical protein SERLA73DRAFT_169051 [Serpula lacrymans var. lacrymans S7.3]EGO23538.1 hypothetical protein SERLADRAFT_449904 [Serpula lacrymans var. lacrymans S7.9]
MSILSSPPDHLTSAVSAHSSRPIRWSAIIAILLGLAALSLVLYYLHLRARGFVCIFVIPEWYTRLRAQWFTRAESLLARLPMMEELRCTLRKRRDEHTPPFFPPQHRPLTGQTTLRRY